MNALAVALSLALLFVWSLPGTIALRWLLLLGALAVLARCDWRQVARVASLPLVPIVALTLWLLGQTAWLAVEPAWSLDELRGQWLPALLALLLGLLLAGRIDAKRLATAITLVFAAQAAIAVGQSIWHWLVHDDLLTQQVPLTGGKLEMSFVLNLLLAFITVDLFCRATGRVALLRLSSVAVAMLLLLALVSDLLAGARNSIISIVLVTVLALSLFMFDQHGRRGQKRILAAAIAIVAVIAALGAASYHSDPRWRKFAETVEIAWDIDRHSSWLDTSTLPWPKLNDGSDVEYSAYARIAFIHGGLRLIAEHPLGYGYGRNAFGHALRQQYPDARLGHAHSGWIDLGVGGGWPALLLWGGLLGSLMWRGWRAFFADGNPHGLLLLFLAFVYAARMMLDSVNKDHMLQIFLFLIGVLLVATSRRVVQ